MHLSSQDQKSVDSTFFDLSPLETEIGDRKHFFLFFFYYVLNYNLIFELDIFTTVTLFLPLFD